MENQPPAREAGFLCGDMLRGMLPSRGTGFRPMLCPFRNSSTSSAPEKTIISTGFPSYPAWFQLETSAGNPQGVIISVFPYSSGFREYRYVSVLPHTTLR